jgi:hypothetical protein
MMLNEHYGSPPRGSERVLLKIPIRVEGKDSHGNAFEETTYTLVVNRSGGLIVVSHLLKPGGTIKITNLRTQISCSFEVVMRAALSLSGNPEWGVKCLAPEIEIWGVHFPPRTEQPSHEDLTHALLECRVCSSREMAVLTGEQFQRLEAHSRLPRHCPKCGVIREWRYTDLEIGLGGVSPGLAAPSSIGLTRQGYREVPQERRRAVKLPLVIKLPDGREETSTTESISESSLCFACNFELQIGGRIYVSLGLDPPEERCAVPARVVWQCPGQGNVRKFYGAKLDNVNQAAAANYRLPALGSPTTRPGTVLDLESESD